MIVDTLFSWGKSKAIEEAPNGFPSQTAFAREMRTPGKANVRIAPLDEATHLRVDAIVSDLKLKKPGHHEVIRLAYIFRFTDTQIAGARGVSRSTARSMREQAEYWIEAKIE